MLQIDFPLVQLDENVYFDRNLIRNNVTSYTSTSSADFWGCDVNQNQITPDYHQKVGSTSDLTFDSTHQQKAGNQVVMGMQNDDYNYTTTAYVTGQVDFR